MIPGFMLPAVVAGLCVAVVAGYFAPLVVQRGLAFYGHGLGHAAFGGIALGILLSLNPVLIAAPFAMLTGLGIVWLQHRGALPVDTSIGIFFSLSMALGIIFLALTPNYAVDATTYLFGSILAVSWSDAALALGLLILPLAFHNRWGAAAMASFDRELAEADHLSPRLDDYLIALAVALIVVTSIKLVGIVLISAFLVIPAAAARLVCRRFATMTLSSMALALASVIIGLQVSVAVDLPTGPIIVLCQICFFVGCAVLGRLR